MPDRHIAVESLRQALDDAFSAYSLDREKESPEVFALFLQSMASEGLSVRKSYCCVLWIPSQALWRVYFEGKYAFQVQPQKGADVSAFLRDLRTNFLYPAPEAFSRYRASK